MSPDTRPTVGISPYRLACHFIVNTSRVQTIHILYILYNNLYTVIRVYHTPDIVLSKRPKPSMVAVNCDNGVSTVGLYPRPDNWMECFKSLLNTLGRYSRYTPDTLESIFSLMLFLRMSLHICQLMTIKNWMECFKSLCYKEDTHRYT